MNKGKNCQFSPCTLFSILQNSILHAYSVLHAYLTFLNSTLHAYSGLQAYSGQYSTIFDILMQGCVVHENTSTVVPPNSRLIGSS